VNDETPLIDTALEASLVHHMLYDFAKFTARGVTEDDFAGAQNRRIFRLCAKVHAAGGVVTHASVVAAEDTPEAARALAPTLAAFRALVPADHDRLRALARLRDVRGRALQAAACAELGDSGGVVEALDAARVAVHAASDAMPVLSETDLAIRLLERITSKADTKPVTLGHKIWAQAVGSISSGSLTVIAADTNVGKTGYALELLAATAANGIPVGFVSCEDPESIVAARMVASYANNVSSRELQNGIVRAGGFADVELAMGLMSEALRNKMLFAFPVGGTEQDVCGAMSRMASKGCRVVVVDYAQCIEASKRQQDRRNEVRWISARLKAHAKRLDVALILLSQLTMPAHGEAAREPTKHDLKESRDLANAAEWVVVMWRLDENDGAEIHCKLAKSKNGNVGATWRIKRSANAKLAEVHGSYLSASETIATKAATRARNKGVQE
jgi:replicative DNA helicase